MEELLPPPRGLSSRPETKSRSLHRPGPPGVVQGRRSTWGERTRRGGPTGVLRPWRSLPSGGFPTAGGWGSPRGSHGAGPAPAPASAVRISVASGSRESPRSYPRVTRATAPRPPPHDSGVTSSQPESPRGAELPARGLLTAPGRRRDQARPALAGARDRALGATGPSDHARRPGLSAGVSGLASQTAAGTERPSPAATAGDAGPPVPARASGHPDRQLRTDTSQDTSQDTSPHSDWGSL